MSLLSFNTELASGSADKSSAVLPLVEEMTVCPDVMAALRAFANHPGVLLLESALQREHVGRYSFLVADPFEFYEIPTVIFGSDPFAKIRCRLAKLGTRRVDGLPPFQGGAAGLLSYELGRAWEKLAAPQLGTVPAVATRGAEMLSAQRRTRQTAILSAHSRDEFELPHMAVGLYDWVIAWDHTAHRAWIISHGFPETDIPQRTNRAVRRLAQVREILQRETHARRAQREGEPLSAAKLSRQWPAPGLQGLTSNFSRDDYLRAVERAIEYISAGDMFQVNLSQRLLYPSRQDPLKLYERLRGCNPAPFAGYFAKGDWAVLSASPERFVCVRNREVETRPIKGTRKRCSGPEADLFTRDELRQSSKDQAENVMIVDLLRNDLSRVCAPGSIRVPNLCEVESYETVQHLVSEIRGQLADGRDAWNLLEAVFPGGSITGAPKVRAMEIIAELEPTARGPYCGSLFYTGFDGQVDSNILIRTFTCRRGWIQCPVGGGIVAQSDPQAEYEETLHKAEGMLRALDSKRKDSRPKNVS